MAVHGMPKMVVIMLVTEINLLNIPPRLRFVSAALGSSDNASIPAVFKTASGQKRVTSNPFAVSK